MSEPLATQAVTFAPADAGQFVMRMRGGDHSLVGPFTHRRRANRFRCAKCRADIVNGATAYREALPRRECRFVAGIVWCAACVTGGAK